MVAYPELIVGFMFGAFSVGLGIKAALKFGLIEFNGLFKSLQEFKIPKKKTEVVDVEIQR